MKHGFWLMVLIVGTLGVAGYWLGGSLLLVDPNADPRPLISLDAQEDCTLDPDGCIFPLEVGHLSIHGPDLIRPLQPFSVRLEGPRDIESAVVVFTMQGMDMGLNVFRFERQDSSWQARVTLPVCTVERADWNATVTMDLVDRKLQAEIAFETR